MRLSECGIASKRLSFRMPSFSYPTQEKKRRLFESLAEAKSGPAACLFVRTNSDDFIPAALKVSLPEPLPSMYRKELDGEPVEAINEAFERAHSSLTFTLEQSEAIEFLTRKQRDSILWPEYRAGRVTASNLKRCISADPENPSVSLLKNVCYPNSFKLNTDAIR